MSTRSNETFVAVSVALVAIGTLAAGVLPFIGDATPAFRGSLSASALVGLVFALHHARQFTTTGRPHLPSAVISTGMGGWFVVAPVLYDVGFVATAGVQFPGLVVTAFGGYLVIDALSGGSAAGF